MRDDSAPRTPFFILEDGLFLPTKACRGYWRADTLSGRVVGGLLGYVLERDFGGEGLVPVRFCVDLLRLAPRAPLKVETRAVKAGGRLVLGEADLIADGELVARATCQFLRASQAPAAPTWMNPGWNAPAPDDLPRDPASHWDMRPIPAGLAGPLRAGDCEVVGAAPEGVRANPPVLGDLSPVNARQAWVRELRDLVDVAPLSPFTRIALAADFASPLANSSLQSIDYVNSDFTVYLHRLPVSPWLGFELARHHATAGVAIGECVLHDEAGPIGTVTVAALAQRQR